MSDLPLPPQSPPWRELVGRDELTEDESYCWIHHAVEVVVDPWLVCGECGHAYDYDPGFVCKVCAHDF